MKTTMLAAGAVAMGLAVAARAQAADSVQTALADTKPIIDLRLRAENVDQDGIANDAHATTLTPHPPLPPHSRRLPQDLGIGWSSFKCS